MKEPIMRNLTIVAHVMLIIGGLNWLLVGAFQFDLVAAIFGGPGSLISRLIYILVGVSAIWMATKLSEMISGTPQAAGHPQPRT